jgi:ribosomal protein L11 methyltransferase
VLYARFLKYGAQRNKMSSFWIQVNIIANPVLAEVIIEFIAALTGRGVEIDDRNPHYWQVKGFLDPAPLGDRQQRALMEYVGQLEQPVKISFNELPDQDWHEKWRANFKSFAIGQRLLVVPPWDIPDSGPRLTLVIHPGQAFGTGQHASTQLCLQYLSKQEKLPPAMLDVGCGSGILAIAYLKMGGKQATAIDIDPLALEEAHHNAVRNQVRDRLRLSDSLLVDLSDKFPLVAANLTALDLINLAQPLAERLQDGGVMLCSGILSSQVPAVLAAFRSRNLALEEQNCLDEWSSLVLR